MITLHSHLQPQYKYELFHIYFSKLYATMPKGIMGNGGLWYLIEALGVSTT